MISIKRTLAVFLALSLCLLLFAGCKKKDAGSNGNQNSGRFSQNQEEIKSGLDELVKAGTITQEQADKIESALTSMGSRGGNGSRPEGSGSAPENRNGWQGGNGSAPGGGSGSRPDFNGSMPSGGFQGRDGNASAPGNMQGFNPLSQLVSDGTITQEQADAVLQKVMGGFGNGGQRGNNNNTASTANQ